MTTKLKTGRPRSAKTNRAGEYVGFRSPKKLKARLEAAAESHGRSLSTEVQSRLEQSLAGEDHLAAMREELGGPATYAILMILGRVLQQTGTIAAMSTRLLPGEVRAHIDAWPRDPYAFMQAAKAAALVLVALQPPGEIVVPEQGSHPDLALDLNLVAANLGELTARTVLSAVADPENAPTDDLQKWGKLVAEMIGSTSPKKKRGAS